MCQNVSLSCGSFSGSDVEAPQISCPNDIEAKTGEQQDSANVTWQVPTAKDNSGEKVRLRRASPSFANKF